MKYAMPIQNALTVISAQQVDDDYLLSVPCRDYEAFAALPAAVTYEGRVYGKTGWNSDYCTAYYKTGARLAYAAAL